jgi:GNAT superfamily N-acetyltransferase
MKHDVRFLAPEDFHQWLPLWKGYNAFYDRPNFSEEITSVTWRRFFDAYEPVYGAVADHDGDLVGLVHYLFHRSTTMIGPTCYLQDLFTSEAARGKGVGRGLIEFVYEQARRAGVERVYWHTHETNERAMLLYDKVAQRSGFIQYRKQLQKG